MLERLYAEYAAFAAHDPTAADFRLMHPELSDEAVRALNWCCTLRSG